MDIRQQLTLFPSGDTEAIETVRSLYNPHQFALIAAHVTLCREDEIGPLETIIANCKKVQWSKPLEITFDKPIRFQQGKGVLLPSTSGNEEFHLLRKMALDGIVATPRVHLPHLTLLHPRNAICTDEIFGLIRTYPLPDRLVFKTISMIQQENGGEWKVMDRFRFAD